MPIPLERFVPDLTTVLAVLPLTLVYASCAAVFAGWLRVRREVPAPYTRKVFHFMILTVATLVHVRWGLPGVVVYGSGAALVVIAGVLRGEGRAFYEAIARPSDAPHRSLLVLVPLFTTAVGGVLANLLFPAWAHVGYMAVAWGDAVGEPVGTRWGRHRYSVPSIGGIAATRSLEGSTAVLVASAAACAIALMLGGVSVRGALPAALLLGCVTAAVEAVSHHGVDNLTIQLAAAGAAAVLLG